MSRIVSPYSKANPFLASIKERYSLCSENSQKNTFHVSLDITGSELRYEVGDSIAILPRNPSSIVEKILSTLGVDTDLVADRHGAKRPLVQMLYSYLNISQPSRKLVEALYVATKDPDLEALLLPEKSEELRCFLKQGDVGTLLAKYPSFKLSPQELCHSLAPLLPRFYSIASSQCHHPHEIHLTVAQLGYCDKEGVKRPGICSHFLWELPLNEPLLPLYLHPHRGFTLPVDPAIPIIMIGPGTGVAPFRAFMQARSRAEHRNNWLFFGEWHHSHQFFYESFWKEMVAKERLHLDVAFSRDQKEKIYVQHRLCERAAELFEWIDKRQAYVYVCGSANPMAKDVDAALCQIIAKEGGMDIESAQRYMKQLRRDKRYLCDVY